MDAIGMLLVARPTCMNDLCDVTPQSRGSDFVLLPAIFELACKRLKSFSITFGQFEFIMTSYAVIQCMV